MRWLGLILMLCVASEGLAAEIFLVAEYSPKPIYPNALHRAGVTGDVRVSLTVHADGSVSKVRVLQSDHPGLADAAKEATEQWRFKPWTVDAEKLAVVELIAPIQFRLDDPIDAHAWLKEVKCREINRSFVRFAEFNWVDLTAFRYTRAYLTNGVFHHQWSNEERLALIAKLNRQAPYIARECLNSPNSRFKRFLPEEIRKLL